MIKSVSVTNYLGDSVKILLTEAEPVHGFIIESIDGLGPPKANISMSDFATVDGASFNSARAEKRNIVINLIFSPAQTIEETRQRTYLYFPIKKPLEIEIETDWRTLKTVGYVESNKPDIFSKRESNAISIICDDPYFHADTTRTDVFSGIEPLFEFVFSNESVDYPLIEFGSIEEKAEKVILYSGDAECGITIRIHTTGPAGDITIYNARTREVMKILADKIDTITGTGGIIAYDEIIITTMKGNKTATLLREGEYINIINALDKTSDWFTLSKGENVFAYETPTGSENLLFEIESQDLYEGV